MALFKTKKNSNKGKVEEAITPTAKADELVASGGSSAVVEPVMKPHALVNGQLPEDYEWCPTGIPFPKGSVYNHDDAGWSWQPGWHYDGVLKSIPLGAATRGTPGTPHEGYFFVWNKDGTHGGRWARPVGK